MEKEEERPTTVSFSFLGFLPQEGKLSAVGGPFKLIPALKGTSGG